MSFLSVGEALRQGARILEEAGVPASRLSAEVLLAHALKQPREYLYAWPERELREVEWIHFGRYLHERSKGKPTQYITGRQEFYGRPFRVTRDVLIPRPETEHLVEAALRLGARRTVDVGCGSGAIAVTLQLESGARVWATDISAGAIAVARGNAATLGAGVEFVRCDLLEAIAGESVDMVVSNPPYVPRREAEGMQREVREWEPHVALFAGEDGMEVYRRIVADAPRVLRPGGWLVMELGFGRRDCVRDLLAAWSGVEVMPDLAGIPRVIAARRT